jgi:hypothetical protein
MWSHRITRAFQLLWTLSGLFRFCVRPSCPFFWLRRDVSSSLPTFSDFLLSWRCSDAPTFGILPLRATLRADLQGNLIGFVDSPPETPLRSPTENCIPSFPPQNTFLSHIPLNIFVGFPSVPVFEWFIGNPSSCFPITICTLVFLRGLLFHPEYWGSRSFRNIDIYLNSYTVSLTIKRLSHGKLILNKKYDWSDARKM